MNQLRMQSFNLLFLLLFVHLKAFSVSLRRRTSLWTIRTRLHAASTEEERGGQKQSPDDEQLTSSGALPTPTPAALALQQQAAALRAEIALIQANLRASQEAKRQKELADIDRWIEECLYVTVPSASKDKNVSSVELLNSVEKAAQVLRDNRYSHDQVSSMFQRICDTSPAQSRSNCSPLLALLVDAAGKLDCVERDQNPNKRWDGRVERDLRQRLFAMDWGMELEKTKGNDRFL
jgi:hypothetical protein